MKAIIVFVLFAPFYLFGQEFEYKVSNEKKIDDDLVLQKGVLTIFNNTSKPLCLKLSSTFREKILSRDTIMLAAMTNDTTCQYFKLWISDENKRSGYEDFHTYPLVLDSKASFTAPISILLNLNCKNNWLEYRYLSQGDLSYSGFIRKTKGNRKWDTRLKSKFRSVKIPLATGAEGEMVTNRTSVQKM